MNAMSLKKMVVVLVLVGVLAGFVQADKLELQVKLSKEVKIQLKDVTIVEALEEIGEKAGLEIVLSDEALWKLPQGAATRLSVMLQGPLAESLTDMLNAFFVRYAVGEERITIYPRPELEHILGRPTFKQLELLKDIYIKPVTNYWVGEAQRAINEALGREVLVLPIDLHKELNSKLSLLRGEKVVQTVDEETEEGERKVVTTRVTKEWYELSAPVTVAQLLSRRNWAWYLSGVDFLNQIPEIHIVGEGDFRKAKLDQIVDVYTQGDAAAIIQRLANWTGMELHWRKRDPLWPGGGGNMLVDMQNVKLGQALRDVVAMVDGSISINTENNQIVIAGPMHEKKGPTPTKGRGPRRPPKEGGKITRAGGDYVGKISIPMDGGKYYIEFMLRESDLTEELRKLRDEKMEQILGRSPKPRPAATPPKPAPAPKPAARRSR